MHSIGNQLILSSKKSKSMIAYLTHADLVQCEVIVIERMSLKGLYTTSKLYTTGCSVRETG